MVILSKNDFIRILFLAFSMVTSGGLLFSGCGLRGPNTLNPAIAGPQLVVNPGKVSLGIAALVGTNIIFEGSGFQPGESVFISLAEPGGAEAVAISRIKNPDGTYTMVTPARSGGPEVIAADAKVGRDGTFKTSVSTLTKVTGILKADMDIETFSEDAEYRQSIVITREPIPAGVYTVRATGMLSDLTAETTLTINAPSLTDRFKDWIGKKLGKIQDKRE